MKPTTGMWYAAGVSEVASWYAAAAYCVAYATLTAVYVVYILIVRKGKI